MSKLLTAIRAAVLPGAIPDSLEPGEPDATASILEAPQLGAITTGGDMSATQTAPGAATAAAVGTLAAVAAAAQGGGADGFKAAMDRMEAVLSADGIKGDAGRMSAALDLAKASPDMAADAVVAFVAANVPAAQASAGGESYEKQRLAAAPLASPTSASTSEKAKANLNPTAIFASRRQATKGA